MRLALLLTALLASQQRELPEAARVSTVGVPVVVRELLLPGPELEARPGDFRAPIVLRVAAVYPHGTDHRYELVWYGLDPGDYDLRDFLQRADGTPAEDLPPLEVHVRSVLPAGRVEPSRVQPSDPPDVGGYAVLLWTAGLLWAAGLVLILRIGRARRAAVAGQSERPRTLAERLRPLVEGAARGTLSRAGRAELELLLISFWRKQLGLQATGAAEALRALKRHAEAGPLLNSLEDWLHRPGPPREVDLAALLAPYRDLPADALEEPRSGASEEQR